MVADPFIGRVVDSRYEITARLARGGMATVYVAHDRRLDRQVALKIMHAHLAESPDFVARFRREARAAARLTNPGVVAVYDQGAVDGVAYLVMELVDGTNVRQLLESGALSVGEALSLTAQILRPLGAAHRAGLIHRDIKPENVLLPVDGSVAKVADFGLARAVTESTQTTTGNILGTVAYLAPELITDGVSSPQADVFAVGVVLYELLTGVQPFQADSAIQVAFRAVHEDVPAPSALVPGLPCAVDDLVLAMTRRDPAARLADADAALAALRRTEEGLTEADRALVRPGDVPHADRLRAATRAVSLPLGSISPDGATMRVPGTATPAQGTMALALTDDPEGTAPVARPKKRKVARRALIAGVLLAAAGGGGAGWYFGLGPGRTVRVPQIAGLTPDDAKAAVLKAELRWGAATQEYSDTVPEGHLISSTPKPGASVRVGTTIAPVVSRGIEQKKVPNLAGQTQDEAATSLRDAGLSLGAVTQDYSDSVPEGQVISSDPAADTMVNHSTAVALVISAGRRPAIVPDVTGKSLDEAKAAIEAAGLTLAASTEAFSDDVPAGQVISSDPAAGTPGLFYGDSMTVVVSKGPEMVEVPSVTGLSEADATSKLQSAGLQVSVNKVLGGWFGTARSTDPTAGTSVKKGSTVTLYVV